MIETLPDIESLFNFIYQKNWPMSVAILLTFFVYYLRSVSFDMIPKKYLPWISIGIAICGSASTRIIQCVTINHTWWKGLIIGIVEGFFIGFMACGIWSSFVKKLCNTNK